MIVLTNGIIWQLYRIRFEKPINYDLVLNIDIGNINLKSEKDIESLFVLCKESISKNIREDYYKKSQSVNRFIIGNLLLSDKIVAMIRRELKQIAKGINIERDEVFDVIENDVLKRDIVEGEEAEIARKRLNKYFKKSAKKFNKKSSVPKSQLCKEVNTKSTTDQLLESHKSTEKEHITN